MRFWERSEEQVLNISDYRRPSYDDTRPQLFLEEEEELRMEKAISVDLAKDAFRRDPKAQGRLPALMLHILHRRLADTTTDDNLGKRSLETLKAGEQLLEALRLAREEELKLMGGKFPAHTHKCHRRTEVGNEDNTSTNPLLLGMLTLSGHVDSGFNIWAGLTPSSYLMRALRRVRASELEETLLLLPFTSVMQLISNLERWCCEVSSLLDALFCVDEMSSAEMWSFVVGVCCSCSKYIRTKLRLIKV